ncbi:branched-chain amino acid aminotransferase [Klebsormidium nitens]|uniref:Branched-chain-amino-acid aminotransferase n=1 Tax=Klebsormidium nitens TaxID=105231 RepID=A0A0U9HN89_KLENI|nr:branched-chain amino acid aminotransferase [Klebsormidium nitens]|eukprot:GAQ81969.1 branched-chain amino acid aminotransferase [Klebsormidium nitens]
METRAHQSQMPSERLRLKSSRLLISGQGASELRSCLQALPWNQEGTRLQGARADIRTPAAAASAVAAPTSKSTVDIDWDNIGFGIRDTDYMYVATCQLGTEEWRGSLRPFGNMTMSPSAAVLNYGQGVFEGLKASRTADGRILLFRPEENAARMTYGAGRMSMPAPPKDLFLDAVKQTVLANEAWIPPYGKGSLYIRPLLIGTGAVLGLAPAPEFTFLVFVSPVGSYFKTGQMSPLDLYVEEVFKRASPGGSGGVKTISNYAPVLMTQLNAKKQGFADVIYLDAVENKYVEEVSSCNIFVVKGKTIVTPELKGTILPGITRKSVMELARSKGFDVSEERVSIEDLLAGDEVFCTGTAVVISAVGSVTYQGKKREYHTGQPGPVAQDLYKTLTDLQTGRSPDTLGWTIQLS